MTATPIDMTDMIAIVEGIEVAIGTVILVVMTTSPRREVGGTTTAPLPPGHEGTGGALIRTGMERDTQTGTGSHIYKVA